MLSACENADAGAGMKSPTTIDVLLVDDHPVVCSGLAAIVNGQADMQVVGIASSGREALSMFEQHRPDVTLIDLRMPEMSGVEAIRAIRKTHPTARFIVLTTYQGDQDIERALSAGAQGYLLKGMKGEMLVSSIRSVHLGLKVLPPTVLQTLEDWPFKLELSPRELDILQLIVKGLSNRQIGDALGITEGTVKWHINLLLSRLNVRDRTQAAVAALKRGIIEL
jgi:DNA-binding NarL/FixJ family response regulator